MNRKGKLMPYVRCVCPGEIVLKIERAVRSLPLRFKGGVLCTFFTLLFWGGRSFSLMYQSL